MNRATDDLISRASFRSNIQTVLNDTTCPIYIAAEIEQYLELEPAVDAVPVVHGRWVKMTGMMPPEYHGHYECSECGWHMKGLRNSWTREEELSYCPNCGAKMETEHNMSEKAKSNEITIGPWLDDGDDLLLMGVFHD